MDTLVCFGPVINALETFPVWGPVLALVAVVLLVQAVRETWGSEPEETYGDAVPDVLPVVPHPVSVSGDGVGDTLALRRVTCGDTRGDGDPRVSHWPGTGGR